MKTKKIIVANIFILEIFLTGYFDLYGQAQNVEAMTIEQCVKLADEKQQEENARDASFYLNAAAEKSWEAKDYQKAIEFYNRSIKLNETVSNENGIAGIHCNMGLIYFDIGEYEKSYEYLKMSYQYRKEKNEKFAIINQLKNISVTLNKMERYGESILALEEGLNIAKDMNDYEQMRSCFGMLSETYTKAGDLQKAAYNFGMFKTIHDALLGETEKRLTEATMKTQLAEMEKELAETRKRYADYELAEMSKAYEGLDSTNHALLESKTKAEWMIENLQARDKITELEKREMKREMDDRLRAERTKSRSLIAGLCVTVLVVVFIGFFLWQKKKDNQKLENQNALINSQKTDLEAAFSEIAQKNQDLITTNEKLVQAKKELDEYQEKLEERVVARTSRLMKLLDQSRESDKLKSSFFSNMSHEIRTPLNAILGFSQMLYNPNVSEEKRTMMSQLVKSNSDQLLKMVEDIVILSEIDSGIITVQPRNCNIHEMLKEALNSAHETAKFFANDKLEIIIDDKIPETMEEISIDGKKISRILTHLIDNAVKNTENGYVVFGCEASEEKTLRFWVEDTGTGIEEKDYESIYKRFWKHGEVLTQKFRGLGIGLSLCKELIDILDGKISLTSEVGRGSTFSFTVSYQ